MSIHADPVVVRSWVEGWAVSRGVPPPEILPMGFRLNVGLPQQRARYILPAFEPTELLNLASKIVSPWTFIKVCTNAKAVTDVLPREWTVQDPRFMMTTTLLQFPIDSTTEYCSAILSQGPVITAELRNQDGAVVASGRGAVIGVYCIFDQIVTAENYRRRGLGRAIMCMLSLAAIERGCDRGVLVATSDGLALYSAIGWNLHSDVTSAVILE
jgi:GNAT superfamily N-acetyltransferase